MSSEEEEQSPPRRSKSKERGCSASRRTAKEKKPKRRSQRMMSVQRTDSEGDDSFEERGGIEEDFAPTEKLAVDHKILTICICAESPVGMAVMTALSPGALPRAVAGPYSAL